MRILLFLVAGCVLQAHDYITTKITWTREVSRIVFRHCASCHRAGGPAFSLVKFEEARPWAKAIKEEVLMRRMPPWNAVKGFGEFQDDAGLTQEQIEILAQWVEGGAPQGDVAYLPKEPVFAATVKKPGAASRTAVKGSRVLGKAGVFVGIQPGAIPKGGALQILATRPDGSVEPLLWVQAFSPAYRQPYWFKTPVKLSAGTRIDISPSSGTALLLSRP